MSRPGHLAVLDGVTNTPDDTPTEGQLLQGDACRRDRCRQSQRHSQSDDYVWQQEVGAGTGVFDGHYLDAGRISVGFPTADGSTFTVDRPLPWRRARRWRVRARSSRMTTASPSRCSRRRPSSVVAVPTAPATLPTFVDHTQDQQGRWRPVHQERPRLHPRPDQDRRAQCRRRGSRRYPAEHSRAASACARSTAAITT